MRKQSVDQKTDRKTHVVASLFEDLNLKEELTLKDALTVDSCTLSDDALSSPGEIPKYILQKLMIVDYNARAFKLNNNNPGLSASGGKFEEEEEEDDHENNEKDSKSINPMDAFLAVFHCCDDFLRQDLAIKLSACQLSVPFLLPDLNQPSEKVTMLLWALEGIKKSWKIIKDGNELDYQAFLIGHSFPIVTFIRVGEITMSKSRLLNEVISDLNRHHDFFFHKDCKGGGVARKIVDGLVELCWYLPGGRKQQAFEKEVCFVNLRGNSLKFSKQFNILLKISSVIFLLLPSTQPDSDTQLAITETAKAEGKVVLVFNEKRQDEAIHFFDDLKRANPDKFSIIIRAVKKNEDDFVMSVRAKIRSNIKDTKTIPLKDLYHLANDNEIVVDKSSCQIGTVWQENLASWFRQGPKKAKTLLKLQSYIPTIANLERENIRPTRRGDKSEEEYSNEVFNKLQTIKKHQKESLKHINENVRKCLNYIPLMNQRERSYAMTVLKHDLDRMSLQILSPLQAEYCQTWSDNFKSWKEARQQKHLRDRPKSKKQRPASDNRLENLEKAIKESSFGLEHFFREMAQIFQQTEISINNYARAAAELLYSGRPLELMDGDSSYIPLQWLNAVFEQLKNLTKNAKIFVISVLGIQSSGKSTMLNTMFGLEFPVSAGRCTRGAFASLIPLGNSLKRKSNYDYLLVIDTEGLRGSGEIQQRQHDNELATFAIGVADLTVVNIFGENYNEMKEFLEIAVHAFLKMRLVKKKRICQIVHQNVAALDASKGLATERMTLRMKLDEMTKLAAIEENCENEFEELNDVLSFDENEDVFYIPSLWQGSPPMAPMNPQYGQAVQKVKEKIIKLICSQERSPLSISQFQKRVNDLWDAILRENFIFSFRNTIEVRAYTSLDQKFFEESVQIMVTQMAELEKTTSIALKRCLPENRENEWHFLRLEIEDTSNALCKKMKTKMDGFFQTNEDKATLEQWRESIMIRIEQLKETLAAEVQKNCKALFDYLQSRQEIDKMKLSYKTKLLANAKEFITSVEETDDVNACKAKFEQEWQRWVEEVPASQVRKIDVCKEMIHVLCNAKPKLNGLIQDKCKEQKYDVRNFKCVPSIKDALQAVSWAEWLKGWLQDKPKLVNDAEIIRDKAVAAASDFAQTTLHSGVRCRLCDLQNMYHIVFHTLREGRNNQSVKFQDSLTADILLYSFANVYNIFVEMEDRYYREHDIKLDLEENLKPDLQNYFLNLCMKMKKEVSAASLFVNALKKPIQSVLNQTMGTAVAKELLKIIEFQSKGQFHAVVLIQLGEKNSFAPYIPYLNNPVAFLKDQLRESIQTQCLKEINPAVVSLLKNEIEKVRDKLSKVISYVNEKVREDEKGVYAWIEYFVDNCSTLAITKDTFSVATIDESLKDLEVFENQVETRLNDVFEEIVEKGVDESVLEEWHPQPFDKLVDLMFGCENICPFCRALCDQTIGNHACDHSTRNHRPKGIAGYQYETSKKVVTQNCTTAVATDSSFRNSDTSHEWHPYKDYRTVNKYYETWSIAPDLSFEASSYWKWFMATYDKDLAELYEAKKPDIPSSWKKISFDDAKAQMRRQYNLT